MPRFVMKSDKLRMHEKPVIFFWKSAIDWLDFLYVSRARRHLPEYPH
jgi:hypothetical protein